MPSIENATYYHNIGGQLAACKPIDPIIEEVLEAQADLQVALGFLRLEIRDLDGIPMDDLSNDRLADLERLQDIEARMAKSLTRLHALLKDLGKEMA